MANRDAYIGLLLAVTTGCTGVIDGGGPMQIGGGAGAQEPGPAAKPGAPGAMPAGSTTPGQPVAMSAYAPASLRRLTASQYRNTLVDLLGPTLTVLPVEAEPAIGGFSSVAATQVSSSNVAVEKYEAAAVDAVAQVFSDPARRAALVACAPSGPQDVACSRSYVARFGRMAFRRPLTEAELGRYAGVLATVAKASNDFWAGAQQATAALLQSPKFLYRTEYGAGPAAAGRTRLTGYELAARLSFFLWDTTPDAALLDAAERGELATGDGLRAQTTRLLAAPRARVGLRDFFAELIDMDSFGTAAGSSNGLPPSLAAAMREEALRTMETLLLDRKLEFSALLNSAVTFVNPELARHYGLAAPAGTAFAEVALPAGGPRVGLLGKGAFLAVRGNGSKTFPVGRGKFIREELLCQSVPPPPPGVDAHIPDPPPDRPQTTRQRLEIHRTDPACAPCHALLDPVGLPLESFDALAAFRTTELGLPIDTSGELDGAKFADARGLSEALARRTEVEPCLARKVYRYAIGHIESDGEGSVLLAMPAVAGGSHRFADLMVALTTSDLFAYVSAPLQGGSP